MAVADPTLRLERALVRAGAADAGAGVGAGASDAVLPHSGFVIGCDEVGRGALAGPVAVGLCVIDVRRTRSVPKGLRDSKMLSEPRREELAPIAASWGVAHAVGYASADEIDRIGISACLGLAGKRALSELHAVGVDVMASTIILDGHFDWLTPALATPLTIRTQIKADRDCASVAAASVISKVARDRLMIEHDSTHPPYGWARNKGYASEEHRDALLERGATDLHRRTWLTKLFGDPSRAEGSAA
ncbi:ribonuclease HII [Herbiconiux sp.]|uniref:ribonuclease HII n=1 Tax=Herbiconiux sp. TaxID=1871186 RepID=UPI0025BC2FC6|nr:ribonuclease HII [Herbiconiux sp.]